MHRFVKYFYLWSKCFVFVSILEMVEMSPFIHIYIYRIMTNTDTSDSINKTTDR